MECIVAVLQPIPTGEAWRLEARRMEGMAARRPEARRGMAAAGTSLSKRGHGAHAQAAVQWPGGETDGD
jgi:hypothetical protein